MLYHFSEDPNIRLFEPRRINGETEASVWAIDDDHAPHYYFPRDCPRVCIRPKADTTAADLAAFFGTSGTQRVVAIESAWYDRVRAARIYRYAFDPAGFELLDPDAGYYVSGRTVAPVGLEPMDDLVGALLAEGIELRVTPTLRPLRDAVLQSTVNYSMIRLRNARLDE